MNVLRMVVAEIGYRKLNFAVALAAVIVAVSYAVSSLGSIKAHQVRTEVRVAALDDEIRKIAVGMGFNINVLPAEQNLSDFYAQDFAEKTMPEDYVHRLAESPLIKSVRHLRPALIRKLEWPEFNRQVVLVGVTGVVPLTHLSNPKKPLADPVPPGSLIVGGVLADQLDLKVDQEVSLQGHTLRIAKIQEKRGSKDDISIWVDLKLAQELLGLPGRINLIQALECNCASIDRLAEIQQEISQVLGEDVQVIELSTTAIARANSRETVRKEGQATLARLQNRAVIQIGLLTAAGTLLLGLMSLANVLERRSEIGILRAIGAPASKILTLFLSKAALVGLLGAALGIAAGAAVLLGVESPAEGDTALRLPQLISNQLIVVLCVVTPLLALLASWAPAMLAARQDPALELSRD
ncbi:MAG: FtsX-like permease family protein [Planctomycetales bacterium]|nr:FtsX-like permease family protein [Planctomycetales bacterium]